MATYRIKRKLYDDNGGVMDSVGDGLKTTAGTAMKSVGGLASSTLGKLAAGGAALAFAPVTGGASLLAGAAGYMGAGAVGDGLKTMGNELKQ